eukprot:4800318-Pleurochrysis_carterae.AAC.1
MDQQNRKDAKGGRRDISRDHRRPKSGSERNGRLYEAQVTTGVREKDHKLVMAALAWEIKGGRGELRPTKRHTDKY